jgi:hypothetical protein
LDLLSDSACGRSDAASDSGRSALQAIGIAFFAWSALRIDGQWLKSSSLELSPLCILFPFFTVKSRHARSGGVLARTGERECDIGALRMKKPGDAGLVTTTC